MSDFGSVLELVTQCRDRLLTFCAKKKLCFTIWHIVEVRYDVLSLAQKQRNLRKDSAIVHPVLKRLSERTSSYFRNTNFTCKPADLKNGPDQKLQPCYFPLLSLRSEIEI